MRRIALIILAAAAVVSGARGQQPAVPSSGSPDAPARGSRAEARDADLSALTPEAAVALALANNLGLARSRVDLAAAERAFSRSWNDLSPGIALSAGASRSSATEAVTRYGSVGASVTLSPKVLHSMDQARKAYEAETQTYKNAARTLELNVRKAYYSLVLARENIVVLRQSLDTARKSYEQAEAKRKAGLAPELDALTAQVNLENLKPSLDSALVAYESQEAGFKQMLGVDLSAPLSLSGSLGAAAAVSKVDFSGPAGESPDLAALRTSLESARAKERAAVSAARSPALTLSGSWRPQSVNSATWADSGSLSAVLSFSLDNLLPWSAAREAADKARDTVLKTESQLEEAVVSQRISLQTLRSSIEQSLASLQARRLTLAMAERSYALTEEAYRFGTKDLLSLQKAGDNLQESRANLLKEAYNLVSALLDLEYALDVPFGTLGR